MRRAALLLSASLSLLLVAACSSSGTSELTLDIRLPVDRKLLQSVSRLVLSASRSGVSLGLSASFPSTTASVSLSGVAHGASTVLELDGVDTSGTIIASGRTCPFDFEGPGQHASLYFAPTNFFAPTVGAPAVARSHASSIPLGDGSVLLLGGQGVSGDGGTMVLGDSERYSPSTSSFSSDPLRLATPRTRAQTLVLPSVGTLITGGLDAAGATVASFELYDDAQAQLLSVADARLEGRVGHRVVALPDGRAFLSGGSTSDGGSPLGTTLLLLVLADGTAQVSVGPSLAQARSEHASTVAGGVLFVFGGYGSDGAPLDTIELVDPVATTVSPVVAHLSTARAEATASLITLADRTQVILVAGGLGKGVAGARGAPLRTAEIFNPITRTLTEQTMAVARYGHTATVLTDGRVLLSGGFDADGAPLTSVELFSASVGFLTERPLKTARASHVAAPLCDGTVLLVGGGAGAEIYTEPAL